MSLPEGSLEWIAQIVGLLAITAFLLSYQQKKRNSIIFLNVTSRVLYILQYLLLGAFEGALLDVLGVFASVIAQKKDHALIKRHVKLVFLLVNLIMLGGGLLVYEDIFSLFPIAGALLHTDAFWLSDEKKIRIVSFVGSPFWLTYNLSQKAYSSSVGDFLSMVSIATAMLRYDFKKRNEEN